MINSRNIKSIYAKNPKEWRNWPLKNHKKENKVNLIKYRKHTGKPSVTSKQAMEEAICFGWIDTTMKRLDDDRYMQRFSKRTKNSKWSRNTLKYGKELIKKRKMTKAGLEAYQKGLKKGPFDHYRKKNPKTPEDLIKELSKKKNKKAKDNFEDFSKSNKRYYLWWIESAKRPETRKRRINHVVERVREGKGFGE